MQKRKRYAVVAVSNRAVGMFLDPIKNTYHNFAEVVALVDKDRMRMTHYNETRKVKIPCYAGEEFEKMVEEQKPDAVIITCYDGMHHHYIIKALKHDLDVLSEKPLTIDEEKCAALARAASTSKGKVTVTFNYRYAPSATKIRELVEAGRIGKVVSVDLNWYLDTYHGSSYFQRWNRLREFSGGLSIHKACHHFDLVSWWIGQKAQEVFSFGTRNFYGPKGVHNPLAPGQIGDGRICPTCDIRQKCRYYMRWNRDELRKGQPGVRVDEFVDPAQRYEGYSPRQCIYDPQINIEDTYAVVVRYNGGAFLNYSLNASMPYEGYRVGINGTEGRIEYTEFHGGESRLPFPEPEAQPVVYIPIFGGRQMIDVINLGGGHGGGDPLLMDEIFIGPDNTFVKRSAGIEDGIEAVMTGVAVHRAANEHQIISVDEMRKRIWSECGQI
jgi:predicted dehydrogenase